MQLSFSSISSLLREPEINWNFCFFLICCFASPGIGGLYCAVFDAVGKCGNCGFAMRWGNPVKLNIYMCTVPITISFRSLIVIISIRIIIVGGTVVVVVVAIALVNQFHSFMRRVSETHHSLLDNSAVEWRVWHYKRRKH